MSLAKRVIGQRGRAFRRHTLTRKRAWAYRLGHLVWRVDSLAVWRRKWERWIAAMAVTPCPCSGFCCGQQRRYEGPTVSELRRRGVGRHRRYGAGVRVTLDSRGMVTYLEDGGEAPESDKVNREGS